MFEINARGQVTCVLKQIIKIDETVAVGDGVDKKKNNNNNFVDFSLLVSLTLRHSNFYFGLVNIKEVEAFRII